MFITNFEKKTRTMKNSKLIRLKKENEESLVELHICGHHIANPWLAHVFQIFQILPYSGIEVYCKVLCFSFFF